MTTESANDNPILPRTQVSAFDAVCRPAITPPPTLDSLIRAPHRRRWVLAALFGVHLAATLFFLSPRDLLNGQPVVTLDHAFHSYQAARAVRRFPRTGRLHYYDPHFMAGYPTALFDLDMKGAEVFCAMFPGGGSARPLKFYIMLAYLTLCASVYMGSRCLGFSRAESVLALAVILAVWHWGRPFFSHFRYAGMFSFLFASHLSLLLTGFLRRFLSGRSATAFFMLGPLVFLVHPTPIVMAAAPFVVVLISMRRSLSRRILGLLALWCVVVLSVNLVWIAPFFEYVHFKTETARFFQVSGVRSLAAVFAHPGMLPAFVLIGLAVAGAGRRRGPSAAPVAGAVWLLFIAAFGTRIPALDQLEPGRFVVPALIFLAPPAGAGAAWMVDRVLAGVGSRLGRVLVAAGLAVGMTSPVGLAWHSTRGAYRHRVTTRLSPEVRQLVGAVQRHADASGRLMIEDGPAALYDDVHLPGILPLFTHVEQIGGPYPYTFVQHHFAAFEARRTMGMPLERIDADTFREYLDLYNVRWIVTASAEATDFVGKTASHPLWHSSRYTLWQVGGGAEFTSTPGIRVRAAIDEIDIEVAGEAEPFLLKYHWDERLHATPPATLAPVHRLADPVPFIRVSPNGAESVVIRF